MTTDNLRKLDINPEDVVGIGITNQRETTIVWNSVTGQPLYSAIGRYHNLNYIESKNFNFSSTHYSLILINFSMVGCENS